MNAVQEPGELRHSQNRVEEHGHSASVEEVGVSAGEAQAGDSGSRGLRTVLGRYEHDCDLYHLRDILKRKTATITGARGSVGPALAERLRGFDVLIHETDIEEYDVTKGYRLPPYWPDFVFHLAGAKHAPEGEVDPWQALEVNAIGTRNVIKDFPTAKVILASTCKACDPETAYGASKLIAERMVLNAGGGVARFYNVVDTAGNVFETWRNQDRVIGVTDCDRYFISLDEAVSLLLWTAVLPSGRYVWDPGFRRSMAGIAAQLYPDKARMPIPRRRGDRRVEPLHAQHERLQETDQMGLWRVVSPHDPI